jgi:hypothetical protein
MMTKAAHRPALAVFALSVLALASAGAQKMWTGGDEESPLMHPGMSCITCHSRGEGPRFQAAATVYATLDAKDDSYGVSGATVRLTDSKGVVLKLVTNEAGNFFSGRRDPRLAFPVSVKVFRPGGENQMGSPAPSGDCASCHTAKGANGAPGRILAP